MLRDPVDRAFSHYLMDYKLGLVTENFEEIFESGSGLRFQQYFEIGNYYKQVKNYCDVFGRNNIHIIWYSDFSINANVEVKNVLNFLKLKSNDNIVFEEVYNRFSFPRYNFIRRLYSKFWLRKLTSFLFSNNILKIIKSVIYSNGKKPTISTVNRKKIISYFERDIRQLESFLSVNLDRWKK